MMFLSYRQQQLLYNSFKKVKYGTVIYLDSCYLR